MATINMNMMASSSKTLITSSSLPKLPPNSPKLPQLSSLPQKKNKFLSLTQLPTSIAAAVASTMAAPLPLLAEEIEKAQLFDFDLTLPIMMAEFLILMVALDKLYYTPVGKFMDERDAAIKEKLSSVKDTSAEVKKLEEEATAKMRAARAEIAAALNKMKAEASAVVDEKLEEGRTKLEAELAEALANLEKQKEATMKSLDAQISALSDEIVKKVLPAAK
ncbi:hypothetical protein LguiA_036497 [Lonicera macranthoides]